MVLSYHLTFPTSNNTSAEQKSKIRLFRVSPYQWRWSERSSQSGAFSKRRKENWFGKGTIQRPHLLWNPDWNFENYVTTLSLSRPLSSYWRSLINVKRYISQSTKFSDLKKNERTSFELRNFLIQIALFELNSFFFVGILA